MTPDKYQQAVLSTATKTDKPFLLGAIGLNGEAGEVNEIIKKCTWHNKPIDPDDLAHELGDVCWYVAYLAYHLGYSFEQILQMNIDKLKERYPNGFPNKLADCGHEYCSFPECNHICGYNGEDDRDNKQNKPGHIPW